MIMEGQNGTEGWHTDLESNLPDNLSGSVPLVRFWLPLIKQNLSKVTGGSLEVFPMNHFKKLRKFYPPCFEEDGRLKGTCLAMNNLAAAPALAPGDLLLYSPLIPHRTQPLTNESRNGNHRMSLSGTLYEPKLLIRWVKNLPVPASWMASPPELGACWDNSKKEMHGNFNWQSAGTQDITEEGSACFPQVYPQPEEGDTGIPLSWGWLRRVCGIFLFGCGPGRTPIGNIQLELWSYLSGKAIFAGARLCPSHHWVTINHQPTGSG